ncbi:Pkinase-domain-containing protein [Trametes polyzona]|nr:Pkinase-domain-containing protein [Trametes polyzona]
MARVQMSAILPDFAGFTIAQGCFHLRLLERLGNGAYGVVYVAEDLSPRPHGAQYYAVKCLLRHERGSALARQQQREIAHHRAMSSHPNVVTMHAVIEEEFYTFIVLDLCDGGDLFNAIMDRGAFANDTEAIRRTFLQVVDAVEACHAKGIFHRDLKPENILCSRDNQNVYLADFGLSTRTRFSANFGCGSSFYMSPECLGIFHKKRPYATGPSDVWALGTILCNLMTGRNPWHVASPKTDDGFRYYLREGAPWLRKHLHISVAASELFARIFTVDPELRITIPELRKAILAIETFFPGEPSSHVSLVVQQVNNKPSAPRTPEEEDITAIGQQGENWALRPIALCATISADFMTMPVEEIAAVASATCVGTESNFTNGAQASHDTAASSSTESLDDVWSITGPPPVAASPEQSSESDSEVDSSSGSDSEGPITPASWASDPAGAVPHLALDAPTPSECDITMASARLAELRMDTKKRTISVARLFTGVRMRLRA